MATTKRRSLYPSWHRPSNDPCYLDDTLDAFPPYHLFEGPSTPEEIAAARAKSLERGLLPSDRSERSGEHRSAVNGPGRNGREPGKRSRGRT